MIATALWVLGAVLLGTLTGWVGHWALHQEWMGSLAKAHQRHHELYPPGMFLSKTYRSAGTADSAFVLAPLVAGAIGLYTLVIFLLGVPWFTHVAVLSVSAVIGYAHEWFHQAFHLEAHWLVRFRWFQRLRMIHFQHHRFDGKNLGVIWYGWDRLFGTFHVGESRK